MNPQIAIVDGGQSYVAELNPSGEWTSEESSLTEVLRRFSVSQRGYGYRSAQRQAVDDAVRQLTRAGYDARPTLGPVVAIDEIVRVLTWIRDFWSQPHGWAPPEACTLLTRSRLDRQVSLACTLRLWLAEADGDDADGRLILGWANLGALVEGTMRWFLCVYEGQYSLAPIERRDGPVPPDELQLEYLRQFYERNHVWMAEDHDRWSAWVKDIQSKRNSIHAYRDREIGTFHDLYREIESYLTFLEDLEGRVPYP